MFNANIAVLFLLYFLQGIPYGIQGRFLPIYLRKNGMNLTNISYMKLLFLPWICKAFWALIFDSIKAKRLWLMLTMVGLAVLCLLVAYIDPNDMVIMTMLFFAMNMCASSQDIAVDGLAIQMLSGTELAHGNVAQVVGYKTGTILGGGALIMLSSYLSWKDLFHLLFMLYIIAICVVWISVPQFTLYSDDTPRMVAQDSTTSADKSLANIKCESTTESTESWSTKLRRVVISWKQKLWDLTHMRGTMWMIKFVLLYKLGEQAMLSMLPLYLVDKQMTTGSLGLWLGVVSDGVSICGSVCAGWLISSRMVETSTLVRTLCRLRLIPLSICAFLVILWQTVYYGSLHQYLMAPCVVTMYVTLAFSGMLTTSTFTLMMKCSQIIPADSQATHYALLATLEVLGKLTFSLCTGFIVDTVGYMVGFVLFVVLAMLVLPLLNSIPPILRLHTNSD